MKLEKFKEKDNKRKFIIVFTICCVFLLAGVFLYTSFAVFTEDKDFNVINGAYQDPGDIYFAYYVDGQITREFQVKIVDTFLMKNNRIARMESYPHGITPLGHLLETIPIIQKQIIQEQSATYIL